MRARDQAIGALILAVATYYGVLRIAEAKCDAAVGTRTLPLDESHAEELSAFVRLRSQLVTLGQAGLADRLEQLRQKREVWVAPALGPERWAVYVESLGLVRRIYIRRQALLDPRAHLYPLGAAGVPADYQAAFAWLGLGGALRHELAHHDGSLDEAGAYRQELAWYQEIRQSAFLASLPEASRATWDWALESAISSAHKAAEHAGAV